VAMAPDVTPPPAGTRRRRWRPWLVLFGIGVAWKVVVFTLGAAVPRWVIGNGIAHLPTSAQAQAFNAQSIARTLWDHPLERLGLVRATRVMRVDTLPLAARGDSSGAIPCQRLRATVRAYTYFAIPYSEAQTVCDSGVVNYRVFPRNR
jgi:hypothetical protein